MNETKHPQLELISHKLCPYVQRARIVLKERGIPHEIAFIDLADKPAWFREISPLGKVPLLLVDGQPLFESAVISEFLNDFSQQGSQPGRSLPNSMHPLDAFDRARNRSWMEFASSSLDVVASLYKASDLASFERAADTLRHRFDRLEQELGDGPYFNGLFFSLVDAAYAPLFRYFDVIDQFADLDLFNNKLRLCSWRQTLSQRISVQQAVVPDYYSLLQKFLAGRDSFLGRLVRTAELRRAG